MLKRFPFFPFGKKRLPSGVRAMISKADAANRQRDWPAAEQGYAAALEAEPSLGHIWVQYGHALKEQGFLDRAEQAYRRASTAKPGSSDAYLQLGHLLKRQGRVAAAQQAFFGALRINPGNTEAQRELTQYGIAAGIRSADLTEALSVLARHGAPLELIRYFDWEYYIYFNNIENELEANTFGEALDHFLRKGITRLLNIHPKSYVDVEYYRDYNRLSAGLSSVDIYRHWVEQGVSQEGSPNVLAEIERQLGISGLDIGVVQHVIEMEELDTALHSKDSVDLFVRVARDGDKMTSFAQQVVNKNSAAFFDALAHIWETNGSRRAATNIRAIIVHNVPDYYPAQQHLADSYLNDNMQLAAAALYEDLANGPGAMLWTYINLARCRRECGMIAEEIAVLQQAIARFPIDRGIRRLLKDASERNFWHRWKISSQSGTPEKIAKSQAELRDACELLAPSSSRFVPSRATLIRSVALFANEGLEQCRLYRVEQKLEQLRGAGFRVELFNSDRDSAALLARVNEFDAVIFYRVAAFPDVMQLIGAASAAGAATFYEIDDLIFDSEHYPPSLESYGGLVSRADYTGLAAGVPLFEHAMKLCDYGIASTPPLANLMAKLVRSGEVFVHRNALGSKHMLSIAGQSDERAADDVVTILYGSGTKAHKEDFTELLEPALIDIMRRHGKKVQVALVGYSAPTAELRAFKDQLILIDPIADAEAYWSLLNQADINLAVLKPSVMADCKSEIKWLEAAMFGIPSLVSRTAVYEDVVTDGETGMLCGTVAEWTSALDRLLQDPALRRRIGSAAREVALRDYGAPVMQSNIAGIMADAVADRDTSRPRILIVNVFYPPQAIGGATRVVHDNVRALSFLDGGAFDVQVFTTVDGEREGYRIERNIVDGVCVTSVTTPDAPDIESRDHDRHMAKIFGEFLDKNEFDLVHFHCIQRLTSDIISEAMKRRVPYLITAHDGWWISDFQFLLDADDSVSTYDYGVSPIDRPKTIGQISFVRMAVLEKAIRGAARMLTVSQQFAALYRTAGVKTIESVPNGVSALPPRARTPARDHRVRLAHIGGAARHKGYHLIRQALLSGDYRNLHLTVVDHAMSPGISREEIWGTTPVRFIARVEQDRVADLYHNIDVLLAVSTWPESFGLVTREALASGCWVIASDRGAIGGDVDEDVNGFVVAVEDLSGLRSALGRVEGEPTRYQAMPAAPLQFRTALDQAHDLAAIYRELLHKSEKRDRFDDAIEMIDKEV